jgi:hypothetical protein
MYGVRDLEYQGSAIALNNKTTVKIIFRFILDYTVLNAVSSTYTYGYQKSLKFLVNAADQSSLASGQYRFRVAFYRKVMEILLSIVIFATSLVSGGIPGLVQNQSQIPEIYSKNPPCGPTGCY